MALYQSAKEVANRTTQSLAETAVWSGQLIKDKWRNHKPTTLLGWTAFVGAALLTIATVSSALVALSAVLIATCWVGVFVYAFLVSVSTVAAVMVGGSTLFFAGTCAVCGFTILSAATSAYVARSVYRRIKAATYSYLDWPASPAVAPKQQAAQPPQGRLAAPASGPAEAAPQQPAHPVTLPVSSSSPPVPGPPSPAPGAARPSAAAATEQREPLLAKASPIDASDAQPAALLTQLPTPRPSSPALGAYRGSPNRGAAASPPKPAPRSPAPTSGDSLRRPGDLRLRGAQPVKPASKRDHISPAASMASPTSMASPSNLTSSSSRIDAAQELVAV